MRRGKYVRGAEATREGVTRTGKRTREVTDKRRKLRFDGFGHCCFVIGLDVFR